MVHMMADHVDVTSGGELGGASTGLRIAAGMGMGATTQHGAHQTASGSASSRDQPTHRTDPDAYYRSPGTPPTAAGATSHDPYAPQGEAREHEYSHHRRRGSSALIAMHMDQM